MILVTTLSYDQLGAFIKDKQVSLDNADLIFGQDYEAIRKYITDRLGSDGYVMGLRGRINERSVELLSQLDAGLAGDRAVLEAEVEDDEVLSFDVNELEDAVQILTYGLPDEVLFDQLDSAVIQGDHQGGIEIVCVPAVRKTNNIRVTSLTREIVLDAEGITFVRLSGGGNG